jgi:integrase
LTVNALAYLGSRLHAVTIVRSSRLRPRRTHSDLHEKGGKTIRKPVADRLADLVDAAISAGVYESPDDYLIPGRAVQRRQGDRDDRIIWRIVRALARDAGVTTHVDALRAAFAVRFLEMKRNDVVTLKELMGHTRIETTLVYLRRQAMETVRNLTYEASDSQRTSIAPHDNYGPPQIGTKTLESSPFTEKEGFEPSMEVYTPITP